MKYYDDPLRRMAIRYDLLRSNYHVDEADLTRRYANWFRLYTYYDRWCDDMFGFFRIGHLNRVFSPLLQDLVKKAHKEQYPRRRIFKWQNVDEDTVKQIRKKVEAIGITYYEDRMMQLLILRRLLRQWAPRLDMTPLDTMQRIKRTDIGAYRTQSNSHGYAHGSVKRPAKLLEQAGFTVEIRTQTYGEYFDEPHSDWVRQRAGQTWAYECWANAHEYHLHAIKTQQSMMDWAISCWNAGNNPKVMNPFLDDDIFEESMRLHMQGVRR